jgi:hypothetical protein
MEKTIFKNEIKIGTLENRTIKLKLKITQVIGEQKLSTNLQEITGYKTISITGNIRNWNAGQIQDTLRKEINNIIFCEKYNKKFLLNILEIWDKFHLNDLKAGTIKQENCINEYLKANKKQYDYELACLILRGNCLYVDRGYKYGDAWLLQVISEKTLNNIINLFK